MGKNIFVTGNGKERVDSENFHENLRKYKRIIYQIVETMNYIVETRDVYTAGHEKDAAELALAIGEEMGLSEGRLEALWIAGQLHDIGKIVVPLEILFKPGPLNEPEMAIVCSHSQMGYQILKKIDFEMPIAEIVLQTHERVNGTGYPFGLKGKDILPEAKIMAVADTLEAMTSHRSYRPAIKLDKTLKLIRADRGILFDTEVVNVCLDLFYRQRFSFEKKKKSA